MVDFLPLTLKIHKASPSDDIESHLRENENPFPSDSDCDNHVALAIAENRLDVMRGTIKTDGWMTIPPELLEVLPLAEGDRLTMRVVNGELRIRPMHKATKRVQPRRV